MFNSIEIPYKSVMLFNQVRLKPGLTSDDVELEIGEMCCNKLPPGQHCEIVAEPID